jgi:hypothetical protein
MIPVVYGAQAAKGTYRKNLYSLVSISIMSPAKTPDDSVTLVASRVDPDSVVVVLPLVFLTIVLAVLLLANVLEIESAP